MGKYNLIDCNVTKLQPLDFIINRFFMKLFRTSDIYVATGCQINGHFQLPSVLLEKHRAKNLSVFMDRYDGSQHAWVIAGIVQILVIIIKNIIYYVVTIV